VKPIDLSFTYGGFDYRQIRREKDVAIYSQCFKGGRIPVAYEVVVIQRHNGYSLGGKTYPPAEYYPSSAKWGTYGFTIVATDPTKMLQKAVDKMRQVLQNEEVKATKRAEKAQKTQP